MPPSVNTKRGTVLLGDRVSNINPEDWRRNIHKVLPMGWTPITGIMDALGSQPTQSYKFHWWNQPFNGLNGSITDAYTNAGLSSAYSGSGASGDTVYVSMADADAKKFNAGDVVMFVDDSANKVRAYVTGVSIAGTSSIAAKLLEADSNDALASTTVYYTIVGRAEDENSELPEALYEEPYEYSNVTQTMMEASQLSDRQIQELERVDPGIRQRSRMQALDRLRKKKEMATLWGVYDASSSNGNTKTRGAYDFISTYASDNIFDYKTDSGYSGKSWLAGGLDFLENAAEQLSRWGEGGKKTCFCGSLAWLAINQAVKDAGHYALETRDSAYGIRIRTLVGMTQDWDIIVHPLFTQNTPFRRSMFVAELPLMKNRHLRNRNLTFIPPGTKNRDGVTWIDGEKCGYMIDWGLQMDNPDAFGWIDNIGVTNTA